MKIKISIMLLLVTILLTSCISKTPDIETFSYKESLKSFTQAEPGVKSNGFKNTTKSKVNNQADAVNLAKNEVTIPYDTIKVYRDEEEKIWMVHFSTSNTLGGDQSVYMNSDGITLYCVYGE